MTIIGLQRRLVEVGRIRMGEKAEGGRPVRLETWKLTSRDQVRLKAAANAFGGEVREWKDHPGQYELHTTVDALPILLMPGQAISQHYELWSGGGCKRRCDGQTEQLSDGACLCDPEQRECKPHTRLNVLLPDVAGVGAWRLDTSGYYAAVELTGTVELLEVATTRGVLLPARLRIDQRSVLRDGQTRRFPVPTLDIDVRPLEMHAITQGAVTGEVAEIPQGYTPVAALTSGVSVKEGLDAADAQVEQKTRTARSAAPIGQPDAIEEAFDIPIPVPEDPEMAEVTPQSSTAGQREGESANREGVSGLSVPSDIATPDQQKLLMKTAREHGWSDAARYDLTANICGEGIRSVKRVPKDKVDQMLHRLQHPELGIGAETAHSTDDELVGKLLDYGNALDIRQQVDAALAQHQGDREWLERQLARLKERYEEAQGAA